MRRYSGIMGRILGQKPTTMPQCVVDSWHLHGMKIQSVKVQKYQNRMKWIRHVGKENYTDDIVASMSTESPGDITQVKKYA